MTTTASPASVATTLTWHHATGMYRAEVDGVTILHSGFGWALVDITDGRYSELASYSAPKNTPKADWYGMRAAAVAAAMRMGVL